MTSTVKPVAAVADPRLSGRAVKRVAFGEDTIAARVGELGREITSAYPDGDLLVLGLLKGSFIFLSDLVRQITRPLQVDFLVASSYGDGTVSSGTVNLVYDPETQLEGKDILLVEDIVDSGRTLNRLMTIQKERNPGLWRYARSSTKGSPKDCSSRRSSLVLMRRMSFWLVMGLITRRISAICRI